MKTKQKLIAGFLSLTLVFLGQAGLATAGQTQTLLAGQDEEAGWVEVSQDSDNLIVTYYTNADWALQETHLHVAASEEDIPQTKKGNPKVGNFAYSRYYDPVVLSDTFTIPFVDLGIGPGDNVVIAAHAVVVPVEAVFVPAPYYGFEVYSYSQGTKKNGSPVDANRSVPEQGLEFEDGQSVTNFFSLGFGGEIVIEFEHPVANGPGDDIRLIEDTWGSYPVEKAKVYASQDGINWTYLGEADNSQSQGIHTVAGFDLDGLDWAQYIKVIDTSDPNVHSATADGYDLNAVEALQDYENIELLDGESETAWAGGEGSSRFVEKGSWATYFSYVLEQGD